jgi:hypothetical protein
MNETVSATVVGVIPAGQRTENRDLVTLKLAGGDTRDVSTEPGKLQIGQVVDVYLPSKPGGIVTLS